MKCDSIQSTLVQFISHASKRTDIDPSMNIMEMGFINSLLIMQFILYIEKEYEINVDNEALSSEQFHTINGISDYIMKKLEKELK